jgi:hypothetical protein
MTPIRQQISNAGVEEMRRQIQRIAVECGHAGNPERRSPIPSRTLLHIPLHALFWSTRTWRANTFHKRLKEYVLVVGAPPHSLKLTVNYTPQWHAIDLVRLNSLRSADGEKPDTFLNEGSDEHGKNKQDA